MSAASLRSALLQRPAKRSRLQYKLRRRYGFARCGLTGSVGNATSPYEGRAISLWRRESEREPAEKHTDVCTRLEEDGAAIPTSGIAAIRCNRHVDRSYVRYGQFDNRATAAVVRSREGRGTWGLVTFVAAATRAALASRLPLRLRCLAAACALWGIVFGAATWLRHRIRALATTLASGLGRGCSSRPSRGTAFTARTPHCLQRHRESR